MTRIPTVKIVNPEGVAAIINQSDFDPGTMTLWEGEEAPSAAAPAPARDDGTIDLAVKRAEKAEAALADERAARQAAEKAKTDAEAKLEELRSDHAKVVGERDAAREEAKAAQAAAEEAKQKLEATQAPDRMARIREAIGGLDRDDSALWTGAGIPKVEAIETVVGFNISAAERDAAWEALSAGK